MPLRARIFTTLLLLTFFPAFNQAGILDWLKRGKKEELSDEKIVSGLKEALHIGSEKAVGRTGTLDGYFLNEAIKILMPEKLRTLEKGLRTVGLDGQVDEFILSMNRAAERAAPAAKEIFWGAIKQMSFEDARQILSGGDRAATDYFKSKTSDQLAQAFRPVVQESMNEVGATQQYKALVGKYEKIPFAKGVTLDIDQYVVLEALDGLFHVLGEEEREIRQNPTARVTDLLKDVFGKKR